MNPDIIIRNGTCPQCGVKKMLIIKLHHNFIKVINLDKLAPETGVKL